MNSLICIIREYLDNVCPVCRKDFIKSYTSGVGYICYAHELLENGCIISKTACTQGKKPIKTKDNSYRSKGP